MQNQSIKIQDKVKCPICHKSGKVGNVTSTREHGAVVYRKFCRHCLLEFDVKGNVYPPIY